MKRFFRNILLFVILPLSLYMPAYWAYYYFTLPTGKNACYLWGDSQMSQDIDLAYLNTNSNYRFYSASEHGAGVYDFLVFAEMVPANSNVIIQVAGPILNRRKKNDRNMSAISIKCLADLATNGYTSAELIAIVKRNLMPHRMFHSENGLYANTDTMILREPLSLFVEGYSSKAEGLDDKEHLLLKGIQRLLYKKCKIIALECPYHAILRDIASKSVYKDDLDSFDRTVGGYFSKKEEISIDLKDNIFADLTHLNERGAKYLTARLAAVLNFNEGPTLIKVVQGNK